MPGSCLHRTCLANVADQSSSQRSGQFAICTVDTSSELTPIDFACRIIRTAKDALPAMWILWMPPLKPDTESLMIDGLGTVHMGGCGIG